MGIVITEVMTLLDNGFSSPLEPTKWTYTLWQRDDNPSFYGRTQQRQELPLVLNGELQLQLDTYNPTNDPSAPSFFGSDAITTTNYSNDTGGVAFEFRAHFKNMAPGMVGGMYTYSLNPDGTTHNEIDFEAVSNHPNEIQTNLYTNEPHGAGRPQFDAFSGSGSLTDYHTYRIEWFKDAIRWLVDGQLVRIETNNIPQKPMALNFCVWAPGNGPDGWLEAYSASLNPVTNAADNTSYYFNVDSVNITRLSSTSYFTTTDITPPIVTAITPAEGANGVSVGDNVVLIFSEDIKPGTGSIAIHSGSATGAVVESFDAATSANLTISGNILTINPTANLGNSTHYYVTLGAGAVNDLSDNPFAGSTIDFTTADPYVTPTSSDNSTGAIIAGVAATGLLAYLFIL